jgi:competence protein ComEA
MLPKPPTKLGAHRWVLRRLDQAVIAALCLFGLTALIVYWTTQGGLRGRLIEIEHADPATAEFKVNVNTAEWTELVTIPEIGETLAQRIVQYRQDNGPYQSPDELRHVRGIGPKTLERLKAYVLPIPPAKLVAK